MSTTGRDGQELVQWVVYDHPRDYPEGFIARKWLIGADGITATNQTIKGPLDQIRNWLLTMEGLYCLPRFPDDDPKILEVWL